MPDPELMIRIRADAAEADAAFARVAKGARQVGQQIQDDFAVSAQQMAANTGNLAAQFQDIGVMMAAGQSPFITAIQQGTQISAVLGPLGAAGAVKGLGAAFLSLLSPVSLLTIGVIAGVAALGQWAMGAGEAGEEAQTLEDRLGRVSAALSAASESAGIARTPIAELREEYGAFADELQNIARQMVAVSLSQATQNIRSSLEPVKAQIQEIVDLYNVARENLLLSVAPGQDPYLARQYAAYASQFLGGADQMAADAFGLTADQISGLMAQLEAFEQSASLEESRDNAAAAAQYIIDMAGAGGQLPGPLADAAAHLEAIAQDLSRALVDTSGVVDGTEGLRENIRYAADDAERFSRAMREAGSTDLTHPRFGTIAGDRDSRAGRAFTLESLGQASDGGILDLIAYAEGTDRPGRRNYNETLGFGAFTGGPVNLTSMTLDQVLEMQRGMLAHPNNTFNSSAAGRYQIVSATLRDLMSDMQLSGSELFDEDMQDRMAMQLIRQRGTSEAAFRGTWQAFDVNSDYRAAIPRALAASSIPAVDAGIAANAATAAQEQAQAAEQARTAYDGLAQSLGLAGGASAELARGQEVLDAALAAGVISAQEYTDAMSGLRGAYAAAVEGAAEATPAFQYLQNTVDQVADAWGRFIATGEDFRASLGRIFQGIAADLAASGMRNLLMGTGGINGGGILGGILSLFTGAPSVGAPAVGAASVAAPMLARARPEMAAARAASGKEALRLHITSSVDRDGNIRPFVEEVSGGVVASYDQALPRRVRAIQSDPRGV